MRFSDEDMNFLSPRMREIYKGFRLENMTKRVKKEFREGEPEKLYSAIDGIDFIHGSKGNYYLIGGMLMWLRYSEKKSAECLEMTKDLFRNAITLGNVDAPLPYAFVSGFPLRDEIIQMTREFMKKEIEGFLEVSFDINVELYLRNIRFESTM